MGGTGGGAPSGAGGAPSGAGGAPSIDASAPSAARDAAAGADLRGGATDDAAFGNDVGAPDARSPVDGGTAPGLPPQGQCIASSMLRGMLPPPAPNLPAATLDLSVWKITLPVLDDLNCGRSASAKEVKQPLLNQFKDDRFFFMGDDGGVVFRAGAEGAATTTNSKYPRSELREAMPYDPAVGPREASWATNDGKTHAMTMTQAVTSLPMSPRKVVVAQIHDADDDLIMVALTDRTLAVEWMDGKPLGTLDAAYTLGTKYTLKIEARNGTIRIFYNDMNTPKVQANASTTGCYFKAGAYSQSLGSGNSEVRIYALEVSHL